MHQLLLQQSAAWSSQAVHHQGAAHPPEDGESGGMGKEKGMEGDRKGGGQRVREQTNVSKVGYYMYNVHVHVSWSAGTPEKMPLLTSTHQHNGHNTSTIELFDFITIVHDNTYNLILLHGLHNG